MAQHGINAGTKRKFKATTNSAHQLPVPPSPIERDFSSVFPHQIWTTDITYLDTDEGWLYLTVMLDLFNRQVVGFSSQPRMTYQLAVDALGMAWLRRRPQRGLIVHSDRGSQYCSKLFQTTLKAYGMQSSMSPDCWDTAPTESLWGPLKRASAHGRHFTTREQAKAAVLNWLVFYNSTWLHSTLGYVSPMQFDKTGWQNRQNILLNPICYGIRNPGARSHFLPKHLTRPLE